MVSLMPNTTALKHVFIPVSLVGFAATVKVQFRREHNLHLTIARYRALRSVLTIVILKLKTFSITHYMQVIISKIELRYK